MGTVDNLPSRVSPSRVTIRTLAWLTIYGNLRKFLIEIAMMATKEMM